MVVQRNIKLVHVFHYPNGTQEHLRSCIYCIFAIKS